MTESEVVAREAKVLALLASGFNKEAWEIARFAPGISGATYHAARMAYVYEYND